MGLDDDGGARDRLTVTLDGMTLSWPLDRASGSRTEQQDIIGSAPGDLPPLDRRGEHHG